MWPDGKLSKSLTACFSGSQRPKVSHTLPSSENARGRVRARHNLSMLAQRPAPTTVAKVRGKSDRRRQSKTSTVSRIAPTPKPWAYASAKWSRRPSSPGQWPPANQRASGKSTGNAAQPSNPSARGIQRRSELRRCVSSGGIGNGRARGRESGIRLPSREVVYYWQTTIPRRRGP